MAGLAQPSAAGRNRTLAVITHVGEASELAVVEPDGRGAVAWAAGFAADARRRRVRPVQHNRRESDGAPRRSGATGRRRRAPRCSCRTGSRHGLTRWDSGPRRRNGTIVVDLGGGGVSQLVAVDRTGRATPLSAETPALPSPDGFHPTAIALPSRPQGPPGQRRRGDLDPRSPARTRCHGLRLAEGTPIRSGRPTDSASRGPGARIEVTPHANRNSPAALRAVADIYWQAVDRSTPPEKHLRRPTTAVALGFTPKGRHTRLRRGPRERPASGATSSVRRSSARAVVGERVHQSAAGSCLPTGSGSPTRRARRDAWRCTCAHSPDRGARRRSRWMAVTNQCGPVTVASCSIRDGVCSSPRR